MSDWFAARTTEAAANAALDLAMPGPDGPWGDALVAAVRDGRVPEAAIDDKVLRSCGSPRASARSRASPAAAPARGATRRSPPSCARPPRPASCSRATTACCRSTRRAARSPSSAQRGGRAHARRRQRDGLPALHRLAARRACAPRSAGVEVHARARRRAHTRIPSPRRGAAAGRRPGRASSAADGELGPSSATAPRSPGLGTLRAGTRRAVEVRATLRARDPGEHVIGVPGVGRYRLTLDGEEVFDGRVELSRGRRPRRGASCARRSTASR